MKYLLLRNLVLDGKTHERGDTLELTDKALAERLIEKGTVQDPKSKVETDDEPDTRKEVADQEAAAIVARAEEQAQKVREAAEADAKEIRDKADADAKALREQAAKAGQVKTGVQNQQGPGGQDKK